MAAVCILSAVQFVWMVDVTKIKPRLIVMRRVTTAVLHSTVVL